MKIETAALSSGFQRLYADASLYAPFSTFIPVSFQNLLPYRVNDVVIDKLGLLEAETAHLAQRNDHTRRGIIEAYSHCGLLPEAESASLRSAVDYYDADFFELMGMLYANAGMFKCALRWHREMITELETRNPNSSADSDSVYASVGYCLCSLGLYAEAITWSKACLGPRPMADAVCESLIEYEAQKYGGVIRCIERSNNRTRYTVSASEPALATQNTPGLKNAIQACAPFQEFHLSWISDQLPGPGASPDVYPFKCEFDGSETQRHKMNLLFATCGQADFLLKKGYAGEAKRLLNEAALLEPGADFIREWIESLR